VTRRWTVVVVVAFVALLTTTCTRSSAKAAGRLTVAGRAEVAANDGGLHVVTHTRTLRSGEQVRVIDGTAVLGLGRGRQLELRKGSVVRLAVTTAGGQSDTRGELVAGDALVETSSDAAILVAGDTTVQVTGVARVSRAVAVVVGVYRGAAGVESAGRSASVPALRQVTVPAPGLPSRATPLAVSASDTWDQRYLGAAIDLGNQLVARSRGFTAQLPAGTAPSAAFFRQILPGLASQPIDSLLDPTRPAGETLVGAAITLEGTKGQFADRWSSVFGFHDDGASWGLVALDQGVAGDQLTSTIDAAINRAVPSTNQVAAPAPPASGGTSSALGPIPTVPSTATATTPTPPATSATGTPGGSTGTGGASAGTGSTGSTGTGTTGTGAASTGTGTTGTGTAPTTLPGSDRGPIDLGIPLVDNTLNAVIDTLSGLLRALSTS
jgi:hypothetical protein